MNRNRPSISILFLLLLTCACLGVGLAPERKRAAHASVEEGRRAFAEGVRLLTAGDPTGAKERLERSLDLYSGLRDYQLVYLAQAQAALGNRGAAETLYAEVVERYPRSVLRPQALLHLAELAFAAGDSGRAHRLATEARHTPGASDQIKLAARLLALKELEAANPERAYERYLNLRVGGPEEVAAVARARQEVLRKEHPELFSRRDPATLVKEARARLAERNAAGVLELLRPGAEPFRGHPLEAERQILLARAVAAVEGLDQASAIYEQVWQKYPQSEFAPTALYELAYALWNRRQDSRAEPLFAHLLRNYPRDARADSALYALGRIAEEGRRFETALRRYRALAENGRDSSLREEGAWRVGWVHYQAGNYEAASRAFSRRGGAPGAKTGRFSYWQARSVERLERERGLAEVPSSRTTYCRLLATDPDSYYAGLAEARLAAALRPSALAQPPLQPLPAPLLSRYSFHLDRSRELSAIDLREFASEELAALEREAQERKEAKKVALYLVGAYSDIGDYARAARSAVSFSHQEREKSWLESQVWSYAYPLAYWEPLAQEAAHAGVDPCLALALMRQESFFDARALSPAKAVGLMQLLLRTAREVASSRELLPPAAISEQALFDPATNVRLGIHYLARLLDLARGRLPRALAAYNAGEEALSNWEARYPDDEEDEFVEHISYPETRSYVKQVLANLRLYRYLYGEGTCRSDAPWRTILPWAGADLRSVAEVCG